MVAVAPSAIVVKILVTAWAIAVTITVHVKRTAAVALSAIAA
jgi:hypothetical protein